MDRALDAYRTRQPDFARLSPAELRPRLDRCDALLLDARPHLEYNAGHIPAAISIPIDELPNRLDELPTDKLIVAYCRGPLCVYADQALDLIVASGRQRRSLRLALLGAGYRRVYGCRTR